MTASPYIAWNFLQLTNTGASLPVQDSDMRRYNPNFFFQLGMAMGAFELLLSDETPDMDTVICISAAALGFKKLSTRSDLEVSQECRDAAGDLSKLLTESRRELEHALSTGESHATIISQCTMQADRLRLILELEFPALQLFYPAQVLAYDRRTLIEHGHKIIPEDLWTTMTEPVRDDLKSGCRALAFDLPTSSAFHFARATEGCLVQFVDHFFEDPNDRTWGDLMRVILDPSNSWRPRTSHTGYSTSTRLSANLNHIRMNYRNPVIHPKESVTMEEFHQQVGSYISVIAEMLTEVQNNPRRS